MKSRTFLTVSSTLALALLKSLPCMAQFEIAPDHFDTPTIKQVSPAGTIATANQRAGGFQGQCTLLHEVGYAGVTLPPGTYSLSIRPHGSWDLVTLALNGSDAKIQAHLKPLSGAGRPTALILESNGQQHTLAGISLQQPRMALHLQGAQSRAISADSELVPISYVTRVTVGN